MKLKPQHLRTFHRWATIFWIIMLIPSMIWLMDSVPYLVFMSVYAIVGAHSASWQAARAETRVQKYHDEDTNQEETPMENQHRRIEGYREFDEKDVDHISTIKSAEKDIGQLWQQIENIPGVDKRALALAKTSLQEGFMWFVRAVAKPTDVFTADDSQPKN